MHTAYCILWTAVRICLGDTARHFVHPARVQAAGDDASKAVNVCQRSRKDMGSSLGKERSGLSPAGVQAINQALRQRDQWPWPWLSPWLALPTIRSHIPPLRNKNGVVHVTPNSHHGQPASYSSPHHGRSSPPGNPKWSLRLPKS